MLRLIALAGLVAVAGGAAAHGQREQATRVGGLILFWSIDPYPSCSMSARGGDVRRLTRARGENVGGSWSPDGSRIVFSSTRFGRSHLFVMRAGGGRARELTQREDFDPVWR